MKNVKKIIGGALAAATLVLALSACGTAANTQTTQSASSSAPAALSGTVSTNGSTSMEKVIGSLKEQFMSSNPGVTVSYDATGSGTGIEAVANGTCDIGLSSRALKDEETAKGLVGTTIALDGIAIIVNADSKVADLSVDQISQIFTGAVTDWSAVGGGSGAIACIGRESGSGTRDGFESITKTKDKCKLSQELTSTGAVIEAVKNNKSAVGYASLSAVEGQDGIKVLTVGGVECNEANILNGSYVIQRPFLLVTNNSTALSPAAQAFFDFATSKDASSLIEAAGAVPAAK
jgi:phosphate transport system substrate-binding protein